MGGPRSDGPACLLVCVGKDCRADRGFDALMELAEDLPHAYTMPCQGLCHGPIAGVRVDGHVWWFERVRTRQVRAHLAEMLRTGRRPKALKKLEVRDRRDEVRAAKRARSVGSRSRRRALPA